jgi:cytidyltransferase-like protein
MSERKQVVVCGAFDDIRGPQLRFLEEASKLGDVTVLLWPDDTVSAVSGKPPKFPQPERVYFLNAVRYVSRVVPLSGTIAANVLPRVENLSPRLWVDVKNEFLSARQKFAEEQGVEYHILGLGELAGFPEPPPMPSPRGRKKVIATGCYDWFHSGHVRFTEEASAFGDLYLVVGHDANIRLLKGEGHPLFSQEERRYVVGSIRYVKQALISSGNGWLDAEPEILRLKPDAYIVNEDGDKGGKREYCKQHGIEYIVLKRTPAPGLPKRSSTELRGF